MKDFKTEYWSYGIYDGETNSYRYLFTCKNDNQARRQFIAYAVGSNDLFNEPLSLHKLSRIGSTIGDIEEDFVYIISYEDIDNEVQEHRKKLPK